MCVCQYVYVKASAERDKRYEHEKYQQRIYTVKCAAIQCGTIVQKS